MSSRAEPAKPHLRLRVAISSAFCFVLAAAAPLTTLAHAQTSHRGSGPPSKQAIDRFFGERRQPIYFDGSLARQFASGIGGGADEDRRLADGLRFLATCRPQNCMDKAAAVIGPGGRILAAGMIGFRCRERGAGVAPCDEHPSAYVFVRRAAGKRARNEVRTWALRQLAASTDMNGERTTTRNVAVVELD